MLYLCTVSDICIPALIHHPMLDDVAFSFWGKGLLKPVYPPLFSFSLNHFVKGLFQVEGNPPLFTDMSPLHSMQ